MEKTAKTHYLRNDSRIISLRMIIKGLSETIKVLENKINEIHWYDGDWFLEESEPIYGLAFIAFQNYINGSIKDFADSLKAKESYYTLGQNCNKGKKSKIELIIGLANYAKHKDEGKPHKGTKNILDHFKLNYNNITFLDKSPIFQGITLLNSDRNLIQITNFVAAWREDIWSSIE
ncbi:MAG: hypothetical protein ACJAUV_000247 [Flavobacteriales bacterium]|jgi:hypothetical protein